MNTLKFIIVLSIFSVLLSCSKNNPANYVTDGTNIVNEFVYSTTADYYLWTDYIPYGINYNAYADPYQLFEDLKYSYLDHWSFLSDDYQLVLKGFL